MASGSKMVWSPPKVKYRLAEPVGDTHREHAGAQRASQRGSAPPAPAADALVGLALAALSFSSAPVNAAVAAAVAVPGNVRRVRLEWLV